MILMYNVFLLNIDTLLIIGVACLKTSHNQELYQCGYNKSKVVSILC